jgi:hypothetical protein
VEENNADMMCSIISVLPVEGGPATRIGCRLVVNLAIWCSAGAEVSVGINLVGGHGAKVVLGNNTPPTQVVRELSRVTSKAT